MGRIYLQFSEIDILLAQASRQLKNEPYKTLIKGTAFQSNQSTDANTRGISKNHTKFFLAKPFEFE